MSIWFFFFFFFKQKTAYEMRISDWSSDVCSSDLHAEHIFQLFRRHFFDAAAGQLIELFDRDWREVPQEGRDGGRRLREPGHFFEWAWLLHRHAALTIGRASCRERGGPYV